MPIDGLNTKVAKVVVLLITSILFVSVVTMLAFEFSPQYDSAYLMAFSYGYSLLYLSLQVVQLSLTIYSLKIRFKMINDNLQFTFKNISMKPKQIIYICSNEFSDKLARLLTELYCDLCDEIDIVNSSFTFQIIPFMIYDFTANLFATYSIIRDMYIRSPVLLFSIATNASWVIFHTFILAIPLYYGCSTTKIARKTPLIVSEIVETYRQKGSVNETFKTFLMHLQFRNLNFENEFVRVDWKIMITVS